LVSGTVALHLVRQVLEACGRRSFETITFLLTFLLVFGGIVPAVESRPTSKVFTGFLEISVLF